MEILLETQHKIMTDSEAKAEAIVQKFKESHKTKKSTITKKVKKGIKYWIIQVIVEEAVEKDMFDMYLAEE